MSFNSEPQIMVVFSGIQPIFLLRGFRVSTNCLVILIAVILLPGCAFGQDSATSILDRMQIKDITMSTGYGEGNIDDGVYKHILLTVNIGVDLATFWPQLEHHRGVTSLFWAAEFNPVVSPETGVEFGMSLGIKHRIPLNKTWHVYVMGAVGPHYITVETEDQADGFIFFDRVGAGVSFFITARSAINFEYRFRHASNASTHEPNEGINSHIGALGYSLFF